MSLIAAMCESQFNGSNGELLGSHQRQYFLTSKTATDCFFLLLYNRVKLHLSPFDDLIDFNKFPSQG